MKKLAIACLFVMTLALVGCSSLGTGTTPPTAQPVITDAPTAAPTDSPTDAPTSEPTAAAQ